MTAGLPFLTAKCSGLLPSLSPKSALAFLLKRATTQSNLKQKEFELVSE